MRLGSHYTHALGSFLHCSSIWCLHYSHTHSLKHSHTSLVCHTISIVLWSWQVPLLNDVLTYLLWPQSTQLSLWWSIPNHSLQHTHTHSPYSHLYVSNSEQATKQALPVHSTIQTHTHTQSILHYATLIESPFFTYNMHFYGVYWFSDFCLVLLVFSLVLITGITVTYCLFCFLFFSFLFSFFIAFTVTNWFLF